MAKFNVIRLDVKGKELVGMEGLRDVERNALSTQNAIYIYKGTKTKKVYIGQTVHFTERHKQHYNGTEEKFDTAGFDKVMVIFSQYFNRSALDDVESQLITYFMADSSSSRKSIVEYDKDEVINRTGGNSVNDYADREQVASHVILPLWEEILYKEGWVKQPTLDELRAKELVKYSPIKVLTSEQSLLISEIISNPTQSYVINGDAGTGKTVLLTHMVANILKERPTARIGVVVQPNWEKTALEIFKVYGMNSSCLDVLTSTKLIKQGEKYDVIVVDVYGIIGHVKRSLVLKAS